MSPVSSSPPRLAPERSLVRPQRPRSLRAAAKPVELGLLDAFIVPGRSGACAGVLRSLNEALAPDAAPNLHQENCDCAQCEYEYAAVGSDLLARLRERWIPARIVRTD